MLKKSIIPVVDKKETKRDNTVVVTQHNPVNIDNVNSGGNSNSSDKDTDSNSDDKDSQDNQISELPETGENNSQLPLAGIAIASGAYILSRRKLSEKRLK